ncbi:FG-GAP-like repeat-containing protein [Streptomyces sp. BI20]|uniref:FG-GAP-like repeat-containing protein n=1 Tax=Streptomyces sp. BI20 TaxID=3403460 RepID=UPI003C7653EB
MSASQRRRGASRFARTPMACALVLGLAAGPVSLAGTAVAAPVPDGGAARAAAEESARNPGAVTSGIGEEEALERAARTGEPVEVTALRTEFATVYANPHGTLTRESSLLPVRVRQGDRYVPVDETLRATDRGTVAPVATTVALEFSGGGEGPLATITRDGRSLTVGWPAPLPRPVLTADTATYPEVLPGVDLRMKAEVTGFRQLLVVKTPEAARNPALDRLRFDLAGEGVEVEADAAGNLRALNPAGQEVFTAPTPVMWDSAGLPADSGASLAASTPAPRDAEALDRLLAARGGAPAGPAEDVFEPRVGAVERTMPVSVGDEGLALVPDRALLNDPDTVFPVYIDPTVGGSRSNWTSVAKKYPTTSYWNHSSGVARSGHETDTGGTWRSLFTMDTKPLHGKKIVKSTFRIKNTHSWSCTARPVELWRTNTINSGTTWNKQPTWAAKVGTVNAAKGWGANCPAGNLEFDTRSVAELASANKWPTSTLGLRASSESDALGWKKFDAKTAVLSTEYNSTPNPPAGQRTNPATQCTAEPSTTVGNTDVELFSTISDPDGGTVKGRFKMWRTGTGTVLFEKVVSVTSGNVAKVVIPKSAFVSGRQHSWQVQADDGSSVSAWSPVCRFIVDQTRPSVPPTVTSPEFPDGSAGWPDRTGAARTEGRFTLGANGIGDVNRYEWWTSWDPAVKTANTSGGKPVTLTLKPPVVGPQNLYARSLDVAGNRSDTGTYLFYVNRAAEADKPGDLNGDGVPDVYALKPGGELLLYSGRGDGRLANQGRAAAGSLAGASLTHRGDWTDDGYEDLIALTGPKGSRVLDVLPNNGYGHACSAYGEEAAGGACDRERIRLEVFEEENDHFRDADQILAIGDVDGAVEDGAPAHPDLVVKSKNQLWLYFGHPSGYLDYDRPPVLIGANAWDPYELLAPGDRTGNGRVDLLARHRTTGDLRLYEGTGPDGQGLGSGPAAKVIATGLTAAAHPLLTAAPGGVGGRPALWANTPDGKLWMRPDLVGTPVQVGTSGWQAFASLS